MITNEEHENEMDLVFQALAHATRRQILDHVRDTPGLSVGQLARHFDVSRIAVMNHLAVLEKADLIISKKEGRTRLLYLNAMPIQEIHERWIDTYSAYWADRMSLIKTAAEAVAAKKPKSEN